MEFTSRSYPSNQKIFKRLIGIFILAFGFSVSAIAIENTEAKPSNTVIKEQIEITKAFVEALNNQQVDPIAEFFDFVDFGDLVISKLETERHLRRAIATPYGTTNFARAFVESSFILPKQAPAIFHFKGTVTTNEFGTRPMVRLDHVGGGHEFMLVFFNDDNKIIDLFYASKGARVSSAVAGTTQLILPAQNRFIARLLGNNNSNADVAATFNKILALRNQGEFLEVLRLMQSLPDNMQSHRTIIDLEIIIAQQVGDEEYMDALAKLHKYHGDDPTTAFMLVDYHATVGDLEKAADAVDSAIKFWGKDAALLNLKANMLFLKNDLDSAIKQAKAGIDVEPEFEDIYWTLIALQDLNEDFADLSATLRLIKERFNQELTPQDVLDAGVAVGYLSSEEFSKLLKAGSF